MSEIKFPDRGQMPSPRRHMKDERKIRSLDQEKLVAKTLSGKMTKGSKRGDVKTGGWLVECKTTNKESIGIKKEWLEKICRQANARGKKPALVIGFGTDVFGGDRDWMLIPISVAKKAFNF